MLSTSADVLKVKYFAEVCSWISHFFFLQHNEELMKELEDLKQELYKQR